MQNIDRPLLSTYEGRHISTVCRDVQFAKDAANHCAHFVNHVLGFSEGLTCGKFLGKPGAASNIRVHETFTRCPVVGEFDNKPTGPCLVFVTQRSAVNLDERSMVNIPRKHVGIYCDGEIWHYSNAGKRVIRQTPEQFVRHYDGPGFALFFGTFPFRAPAIRTDEGNAPLAPLPRMLREGMDDDVDVVVWQQFLILHRFLVAPNVHRILDGHYGPMTKEATEDFQASSGIAVTGELDHATYGAAIQRGFIPRVNAANRTFVAEVTADLTKAAVDALRELGRTCVFYTEKQLGSQGATVIARLEPHKHTVGTQLRYWHRGITLYEG